MKERSAALVIGFRGASRQVESHGEAVVAHLQDIGERCGLLPERQEVSTAPASKPRRKLLASAEPKPLLVTVAPEDTGDVEVEPQPASPQPIEHLDLWHHAILAKPESSAADQA